MIENRNPLDKVKVPQDTTSTSMKLWTAYSTSESKKKRSINRQLPVPEWNPYGSLSWYSAKVSLIWCSWSSTG